MDVSAYAKGILSLLNAKVLGRGFDQAADFIQPTCDVVPFLGTQLRQAISGNVVNLAAGFDPLFIVVPPNEVWRVLVMGITVTAGAGGAIGGWNGIIQPGGAGFSIPLTPAGEAIAVANSTRALGVIFPEPFLAMPGSGFGIAAFNLAGAANPASVALIYDRLLV